MTSGPGSAGPSALPEVQRRIDEVEATTPLLFEAGEGTLSEQGRTGLDRMIDILRAAPSPHVTVTGYVAPAIPRNPERGQRISLELAEYVIGLLEAAGIAQQRLTPVGAGPAQQKADRAQDRRVELRVVNSTRDRAARATEPRQVRERRVGAGRCHRCPARRDRS